MIRAGPSRLDIDYLRPIVRGVLSETAQGSNQRLLRPIGLGMSVGRTPCPSIRFACVSRSAPRVDDAVEPSLALSTECVADDIAFVREAPCLGGAHRLSISLVGPKLPEFPRDREGPPLILAVACLDPIGNRTDGTSVQRMYVASFFKSEATLVTINRCVRRMLWIVRGV